MSTEQRPGLFITNEELQQFDKIVGELPTKYGIQVIQFFNAVQQKRQAEAVALEQSLKENKKAEDKAPEQKTSVLDEAKKEDTKISSEA